MNEKVAGIALVVMAICGLGMVAGGVIAAKTGVEKEWYCYLFLAGFLISIFILVIYGWILSNKCYEVRVKVEKTKFQKAWEELQKEIEDETDN